MRLWCTCDAILMCLWCNFDAFVIRLWCICDAFAMRLQCVCDAFLMHLWCTLIIFFTYSGIIKEGKVLPSNLGVGDRPHKGRKIQVQCFPLYSVLAALDFPHVDYFSLDIEGAEFVVLETLPQINMTLISIEVNHAGDIFPGNRNDIGHLLEKHGFKYAATAHIDDFYYKKEANRFLKTKIKTDLWKNFFKFMPNSHHFRSKIM